MKEHSVETQVLKNQAIRDNYRRSFAFMLLLLIINVCLVGVVYYLVSNRPAPEYATISEEGTLTRMYPLAEPIVSQRELLAWTSAAVTQAFTLNFLNYNQQLQKISESFTSSGWNSFITELQRIKTQDYVVGDKLSATAVVTGPPVIVNQGVLGGYYTWAIMMPVLVTYESKNVKVPQSLMITVTVRRVSTLVTPRGIAIESIKAVTRTLER